MPTSSVPDAILWGAQNVTYLAANKANKRRRIEPCKWLQSHFWLSLAFHRYRDPSFSYSPFFCFEIALMNLESSGSFSRVKDEKGQTEQICKVSYN